MRVSVMGLEELDEEELDEEELDEEELDEEELLARWRGGDATAGQELFRRSYKVVSRYLRNKVGGDVHGDLVQKTFLACLHSSARYRGDSSFRAYLLGIAHHTLVDHLRAARRTAAREREGGRELEDDLDDLIIADSFAEPDAIEPARLPIGPGRRSFLVLFDGDLLLVTHRDPVAQIWNWRTGKLVANQDGALLAADHVGEIVNDVATSPSGRLVAVATTLGEVVIAAATG